MGFEVEVVLYCDNGCGTKAEYDGNEVDFENLSAVTLPEGWARDYDNGDSIFGFVCNECIEEFGEGGY